MDQQNPNPYLSQMNLNMELFNNLASMEGFNTNIHGIMPLSHEGFSDHHHSQLQNASIFDPTAHFFPSSNIVNMTMEPEIQVNSSPSASGNGFHGADRVKKKHQLQNCGGKKRKRISEREMEKPREVVHVRAKRGQATDSHSLAERLRREKINEKLKCLRDLVPGCYKTMGMAVMLDVIINYLRSLQNQIDFLSMKLSAASLFYDFNSSEAEAMETIQGTTGFQEQGIEKLMGNGFGENSQFQTPWPL